MSLIRLELLKGVKQGSTSVSPQSPDGAEMLASPPISRKGAILLGYGAMTAKTVFNTVTQEIKAGGNEELATALSNGATGVAIVMGAIATDGLSLVPLAVSTGAQFFTREKNAARQNQARMYAESMQGDRIDYMGGGSYE
jgi:hypothetical protein